MFTGEVEDVPLFSLGLQDNNSIPVALRNRSYQSMIHNYSLRGSDEQGLNLKKLQWQNFNLKMVIYLPLLFADGQPTSLERITVAQLEKFIPFMLSCCPETTSDSHPLWWPPNVPYHFPLARCNGHAPMNWHNVLKNIVCRCYEFHQCEHVLRFCSRLSEKPPSLLKYKESSQGLISIYNKQNNKLIVTFKKRNQVYDRPILSPCKSLLPKKTSKETPQDHPIEDIYLCNYCDEEFTSGKDIIAHEAVCSGKTDEVHDDAVDQVSVMRYFGLGPSKSSTEQPRTPGKRGTSVRLKPRTYMQIPFSSPLGGKMAANITPPSKEDIEENVSKMELYCCSNVSADETQTKRPRKFGLKSFRYCLKRKHKQPWTHTFCFNKAQRAEHRLTLKTGLNKKARDALKKCKACIVLVERLPLLDPLAIHAAARLLVNFPVQLEAPPQPLPSSTICIDLTMDSEDSNDSSIKGSNDSRTSSDFFFSTSSNHKRLSVESWSPFPIPSVPHSTFLPIASV